MRIENQYEFAFGRVSLEVRRDFGRGADQVFFELLGQFTHQGNLDFAKDLADFFDELVDVMRACVENLGRFFVFQLFQQVNVNRYLHLRLSIY